MPIDLGAFERAYDRRKQEEDMFKINTNPGGNDIDEETENLMVELWKQGEQQLEQQKAEEERQKILEQQERLNEKFNSLDDSQKRVVLDITENATTNFDKAEEYINSVEKLNEYKLKRTDLQDVIEADKKQEESGFLGSLWYGLDSGIENIGLWWDEAFIDGDGTDAFEGLTKEETKHYVELMKKKNEYEKPIAHKLLKQLEELESEDQDELAQDNLRFYGAIATLPLGTSFSPVSEISDEELKEGEYYDTPFGKIAKADKRYEHYLNELANMTKKHLISKQKEQLEDFINDENGIWDGLSSDPLSSLTLGVADLLDSGVIFNIKRRKENGEKLLPKEEELLKVYNVSQQIDSLNLMEGRFGYKTGAGVKQSLVFAGQQIATLPIGGFVGKAAGKVLMPLAKNLTGKILLSTGGKTLAKKAIASGTINYLGKATTFGVEVAAQSAVMPTTYDNTFRRYIGQTQMVTDKNGNQIVLMTKSEKDGFLKNANKTIKIKQQRINELKNSDKKEDKELVSKLQHDIKLLQNEVNQFYDNKGERIKDYSLLDSFINSWQHTMADVAMERVGGETFQKGFKHIGNKIDATKFGRKYVTPIGNVVDRVWDKGEDFINKKLINGTKLGRLSNNAIYHTGINKIWHGLPAEVMEEIAVQATPIYQEDYVEQLKELANPSFYVDVIAQTLLMGGMFSTVGATHHGYKYATDKKYREDFKDLKKKKEVIKELYRNIDKSITNDQLAQHILMNTGGTLFDVKDYMEKVADLKDQGKVDEAKKLEDKSFLNIAVNAMQTGTLDRFERSIRRISNNEELSEGTRESATKSLQYLPELRKVESEFGGMINSSELMGLSANKIFYRETLKDINKRIDDIQKNGKDHIDYFKKKNNLTDSLYDLSDMINKLQTDETGEYQSFIEKLKSEGNEDVNELIGLHFLKDLYEDSNYENTKQIKEKSSQKYQEKLKNQLKEIKKKIATQQADSSNAAEKKEEYKNNNDGEIDPETTAKINEKAVDSATGNNATKKDDTTETRETKPEIKTTNTDIENGLNDEFEAPREKFDLPTDGNYVAMDATDDLFAPMKRVKGNQDQDKKVESLTKGIKQIAKQHPALDLDGLLVGMTNDYGKSAVDRNFNFIVEAYQKATGEQISKEQTDKLYSQLFPKTTNENIDDVLGVTGKTTHQPTEQEIEQGDTSTDVDTNKSYNPVTEQEEVEMLAEGSERKYIDVGLKLGRVLGLNYKTTPDGKVTVTTEVNESAKPFMFWGNFNPGDKVEMVFDIDYLLNPDNPATKWENLDSEKPRKTKITVKEKLENIFKGQYTYDEIVELLKQYKETKDKNNPLFKNDSFLKSVPVGIVNKGYIIDEVNGNPDIIEGGINDYDWFNNSNIALKIDKNTGEPRFEERNVRLEENRRINLEARKSMLENGSLIVEVAENTDKKTNKRLPGDTKFYSIFSQFASNIEEFEKNATIAYLSGNMEFIDNEKNGERVIATINGEKLTKENVVNFDAFFKIAKEKNYKSGVTVFVHKSGVDKNGKNLYTARYVVNNHPSKQQEFKNTSKIVKELFYSVLSDKHSKLSVEERNNIKKAFKAQFGFELNQYTKDILEDIYPTNLDGNFVQDFKIAHSKSEMKDIPDLRGYESFKQFVDALLKNEVLSVNKKQLLLESLHTNLVFTPITKGDTTIYTTDSQPYMMFKTSFDKSTNETKTSKKDILNSNRERLEKKKTYLENQINNTEDTQVKVELQKELDDVNKELSKTVSTIQSDKKKVLQTQQEVEDTQKSIAEKKQKQIDFLNDMRDEILGFKGFEDSVREYLIAGLNLDTELDGDAISEIYKELEKEYDNLIKEVSENDYKESDTNEDNFKYDIIEELLARVNRKIFDNQVINKKGVVEKSNDQSSYELNTVDSLGMKVKLLLSGINLENSPSGFAGFKQKLSMQDAVDALHQVLSQIENNTLEDVKKFIDKKVQTNPAEFEFYNEILKRLEDVNESNPEIINEIMYNLYKPRVEMKFVMWSINNNGEFSLESFDANANNPHFVKRKQWIQNMKLNGLLTLYGNRYFSVNKEKYEQVEKLHKEVKEQYENNQKIQDVDRKKLKSLLHLYGIELNDITLNNIYVGISQNDVDMVKMLFNNKNGILDVIKSNIDAVYNEKKLKFTFDKVKDKSTEKSFNPLTFNNTQINDLIKTDNFVEFNTSDMMRIAGKNVMAYQQPNSINNKVKNIVSALKKGADEKGNWSGIIKQLEESPVTSNSMLLEILKSNPDFNTYFKTFLISLEALKKKGDTSRNDMGITNLSDKDAFLSLLGLFSNGEGEVKGDIAEKYGMKGLKMRKGVIAFPTVSDSSQLPLMNTIMFNLNSDAVNVETDSLNENILEVLREQLLVSDLKRIGDFLTKVQDGGTNIEGYDDGAIWITGMTSLNTLVVETEDVNNKGKMVKRPLVQLFRERVKKSKDVNQTITDFVEEYKEDINKQITKSITEEVDKFISKDGKSGEFVEYDLINTDGSIKMTGSNGYFEDKSARMVAYDYVINYMLQQKEIQTIFAGDIANYFKNGMSFKYDKDGKQINTLKHGLPPVTERDIDEYGDETLKKYLDSNITDDIDHEEAYEALLPVQQMKVNNMFKKVQNNLSKRLKQLISPGNQYADVKSHKPYLQIMVNDVKNASETIESLVEVYYPELYKDNKFMEDLREFKKLDELYNRNEKQTKRHKKLKEDIEKKIPTISAYLKTTSTDAQEYVSWQDNMQQLFSQGRISKVEYDNISKKLTDQEINGVTKDNELSKEEMSLAMMQPSKPLYSGLHFEDINGHKASRYIYIKSSSFPLLPQLTAKFPKLEGIRKAMVKMGKSYDGQVRISYASANKVGAVRNPISISDLHQDNIDMDKVIQSSVELSRENFYIQQDKPYKSDKNAKHGKEDYVTRATQFEKIILGDDINKMGSIFPASGFDAQLLEQFGITPDENGMIEGKDLKTIYNNLYEREQKLLADKLFNKLGIDSYGDIREGKPEVMENLVRIINKRLSNKQDIKMMDLIYLDSNNKTYTKQELLEKDVEPVKAVFKFPLFLTPNSRKFESVFNSIINNNSINLKLPGMASPVASQEGFDFRGYDDDLKSLKEKGLITTNNFDPSKGLQSQRDSATGKLKYAQVFIANKFKVYNAKEGKYEYIDLTKFVDENGQIDTKKLPEELLSMFSFRIPTSSHQSGTIIEIAGFLPHNQGDLMVVPKEHTVQIGEDYDIDIRYMYQYHYIQNEDGSLKKMEYSDIKQRPDKSFDEIKDEYNKQKKDLFDSFYSVTTNSKKPLQSSVRLNNPYWKSNREKIFEIALLQDKLDNYETDNLLNAIFQDKFEKEILTKEELQERISELESQIIPRELVKEKGNEVKKEYDSIKAHLLEQFRDEKSELSQKWREYKHAYEQKVNEHKVIENNIVSLYKSVFSSTDTDVQKLVTKVLSTDFSESSAKEIDAKMNQNKEFNIYSPSIQRKVMKLGADGKLGIGVHSNGVTINSILQQLDKPMQFIYYYDDKANMNVPYNIVLGQNVFDGKLGGIKDKSGRRISEYLMESQNSATDNQKLEIMGRRNETAETINVFSLLQMTGMESDGIKVNGKELSYASLFISQPIIMDYVKKMKQLKSSSDMSIGSAQDLAVKYIKEKYMNKVPDMWWRRDKDGKLIKGSFNESMKFDEARELTSEKLYEYIQPLSDNMEIDYAHQFYIFDTFLKLQKPAKELNELQKFVNIENGGLGISYFNTIDLKNKISNIEKIGIAPADTLGVNLAGVPSKNNLFTHMFGDKETTYSEGKVNELLDQGYVMIAKDKKGLYTMVKPTNHYSHKIMNSISQGYNLWNTLFPYDSQFIEEQIYGILDDLGIDPETKLGVDTMYDVVSNMKDYMFSFNKELFPNGVVEAQKELFFNSNHGNNEALGSYLSRLKNNPNYSYLFKQPFFKNLSFEINSETHPTLINFINKDKSKFYNLKMYNSLEAMINSNRELPSKVNGQKMTEGKLLKELLMYSLIANQNNGATGFRQILPLSLFEKYGIDKLLRERNDVKKQERQNIVYNGIEKSLESLLGNKFNENGIIYNTKGLPKSEIEQTISVLNSLSKKQRYLISKEGHVQDTEYNYEEKQGVFKRQYIQHNPGQVKNKINYSSSLKSKMGKLLASNNYTVEELNENKIDTLSVLGSTSNYMVLTDISGNMQLFEKYSTQQTNTKKNISYYRRIPTLGTSGFNEYQVGKNVNKSNVEDNNVKLNKSLPKKINVEKSIQYINENNLTDILNNMFKDRNSAYSPLIKLLSNFIGNVDNVSIQVVDNLKGAASYKDGQIKINRKYLEQPGITNQHIQDLIIEEFLHHVTTDSIGKYITFTGVDSKGKLQYKRVSPDTKIPAPLQTLLTVYNKAIEHYVNKHGLEKLLAEQNKHTQNKNSENNAVQVDSQLEEDAYRTLNIHEFIAGLFLKNEEFAKEMANTKYLSSGKSILQKFAEKLAELLHRVLPNSRKDTISAGAVNNLVKFLEGHYKKDGKKKTAPKIKPQSPVTKKPVVTKKQVDDIDKKENSNFAPMRKIQDPFKC